MNKLILGLVIAFSFSTVIACGGDNSKKSASTQNEKASVTNIDADELKDLIKNKPGIILDVRTPGEVANGIMEGAVMIDIFDANFEQKVKELDKTKPVYVYCKVGGRSSQAASNLVNWGFTQVYNVTGGMDAWKAKNYPIVTPK